MAIRHNSDLPVSNTCTLITFKKVYPALSKEGSSMNRSTKSSKT